mmetsp:Transcript_60761/g.168442  ORF Transcript_60761/g.168442 Transcript_60761/m.168442 type:complete len:215 (-) Transcript_60761:19-663(-)
MEGLGRAGRELTTQGELHHLLLDGGERRVDLHLDHGRAPVPSMPSSLNATARRGGGGAENSGCQQGGVGASVERHGAQQTQDPRVPARAVGFVLVLALALVLGVLVLRVLVATIICRNHKLPALHRDDGLVRVTRDLQGFLSANNVLHAGSVVADELELGGGDVVKAPFNGADASLEAAEGSSNQRHGRKRDEEPQWVCSARCIHGAARRGGGW